MSHNERCVRPSKIRKLPRVAMMYDAAGTLRYWTYRLRGNSSPKWQVPATPPRDSPRSAGQGLQLEGGDLLNCSCGDRSKQRAVAADKRSDRPRHGTKRHRTKQVTTPYGSSGERLQQRRVSALQGGKSPGSVCKVLHLELLTRGYGSCRSRRQKRDIGQETLGKRPSKITQLL